MMLLGDSYKKHKGGSLKKNLLFLYMQYKILGRGYSQGNKKNFTNDFSKKISKIS